MEVVWINSCILSPQDGSEDPNTNVMQKTPIILSKPPAERVSIEDLRREMGRGVMGGLHGDLQPSHSHSQSSRHQPQPLQHHQPQPHWRNPLCS